jgi:hypothetical protein
VRTSTGPPSDEEARDHSVATADPPDHEKYMPFSFIALEFNQGRIMWIPPNELLGLFPRDTQPGDVTAIFLGDQVPFLLRPVSGCDEYELVGACHVQGVMDGEWVDATLKLPKHMLNGMIS